MKKGLFITVEGMDGSGKSTQIRMLESYLGDKGYETVLVREPGGTYISEKIRSILLDPDNTGMNSTAEMLLYAAARARLVAEVVRPSVNAGKIVICDRFIDSSYAYQGFGRGLDTAAISAVNKAAVNGMVPDITLFFDVSPEIALKRRIASTGADRIESEKMEFHMRVYAGYRELVRLYPERIRSIDSSRSISEISNEVRKLIDELIDRL